MSRRLTIHHALRPVAAAVGVGALILSASTAGAVTLQSTPVRDTWGTNGRVTEILPVGNGWVVIAGAFTAVLDPNGVSYPAGNLALLDAAGAAVTTWPATTDGEVDALAIQGSTLYLGGKFDKVDGRAHRKLAAIDLGSGAQLTAFTATATGQVLSLAATPTGLFVAGSFTSIKTSPQGAVAVPYVAKLDPTTGAVEPSWLVSPNAKVNSVLVSPDLATVYLGGHFTYLGSSPVVSGAAVTAASPAAVLPYRFTVDAGGGPVNQIAPILSQAYYNGHLYVALGGGGGQCVSVDPATGASEWWVWTDGDVESVTAYDGVVYCGGHFTEALPFHQPLDITGIWVPRHRLFAVPITDPDHISDWNPGTNTVFGVFALANDGATLFAGGDFTKAGSRPRAHYAEFTPAL